MSALGPLDADIQAMLDDRERTMADFTADHQPMVLYAIYNAGIHMPEGKRIAQCGHAFCMSYERAIAANPELAAFYKGTGNGTKATMYAKNRNQLIRGWREAKAAGIPCELIIDRGHVLLPDFDGKPIITALGIGPVLKSEAAAITKRFTMAP